MTARQPADQGSLIRALVADGELTDSWLDLLEERLVALEKVAATRWPARILARHRLAAALRASIARFSGESFAERRIEARPKSGWHDETTTYV